ncbi:MAG: tRNA uridine-5-carboxymethylaminomethyl(34) synthesis enzyme MnmG [Candidatus Spyradocola sp.]|nr:tRNA uridine-5-carboxymethylaminomethyl(34) synthesis enzyme MnmG [Candidatus Spyradocola sp.]
MSFQSESYEVVVIGAGHAGCEAALACARMGQRTLLLTLNIDGVALMPCNPSIGGTAKGHLVREVDALGGEMGRVIDDTFIQSRMLNTGKGPAVHSLRAQADKKNYQKRMLRALQTQGNLTLRQGEVCRIHEENGRVTGVETTTGAVYPCRAAIVATGVYLNSRCIVGEAHTDSGPSGLGNSKHLSGALEALGFELRRFKTGTPARVDMRTVDFSKFEEQPGDERIVPFSFLSEGLEKQQVSCYLGYTTPETHRIIRENLHRAPLYSGDIHGVGPRYCPSIEDKVVRFADRERHPLFLEPEGLDTLEWYVQGMSSSMPEDVQWAIYRSIPGMERVQLTRLAYAIEYDCIDPTVLRPTLESKAVEGLYFAGQINGSSGYEEAAAQGIYAGMNAALKLQGKEPMILSRADAYIGVLVDDLTGKGTNEPYRMMTSRAEYRLLLRQDNADLRLTEIGYRAGLATQERYDRMLAKRRDTEDLLSTLRNTHLTAEQTRQALHDETAANGANAADLLRRAEVHYADLAAACPQLPAMRDEVVEQAEITLKYEGYLTRQRRQVEEFKRTEKVRIPGNIDYESITGLRIEARQKLQKLRPETLGAAQRISGVSPGDVAVLMIKLEQMRREGKA